MKMDAREGERQRETERERGRETEREGGRETEREREGVCVSILPPTLQEDNR